MVRVLYGVKWVYRFMSTVSTPPLSTTQPASQRTLQAISLSEQPPRLEAEHSPQNNVEVKNAWSYDSCPPYVFRMLCLFNECFNFTFCPCTPSFGLVQPAIRDSDHATGRAAQGPEPLWGWRDFPALRLNQILFLVVKRPLCR